MENKNKMMWIWVIVGVVVIAGLWWYASNRPVYPAPEAQPPAVSEVEPLSGGDTTADIVKDFGAIDLGDIDKDLEQLDADIEQL